ncbi:hypothetical protein [Gallaecimonas pentaromativorans]|uniref:Lipoprotein n=1 Tax=Gallaecimonas pentaromativorans TaxID=584787 RepID=A0A3N1NWQ4_9GAMM|nr:hypothetical protein [Gallaecimonas pentaromativorans]ROQ23312.1 hypothetical protein EDC28_10850 [Gallaecimonas pentaromativorans]
MSRLFPLLVGLMLLGGCASHYHYDVDPTPLKKGVTHYRLKDVQVNLTLGHGAIPGDTTFAPEQQLHKEFVDALTDALKTKGILAAPGDNDVAEVVASIDFERTFNIGGHALNKPILSDLVKIEQNGQQLASFGHSKYTTKYSYFEDLAVNAKITVFQWGAEDEPRDVKLVAESIVNDIAALGK